MKNKKILAGLCVLAILSINMANVFATKIGDVTVTDVDSTVNPTITHPDWDGNYPVGNITGKAENIVVRAKVKPTLNMGISSDIIDLGVFTPGTKEEGNVEIEVGTNAKDGVVVTVQSKNGALKNKADSTLDLLGEYKFSSENQNTGTDTDSDVAGFAVSNTLTETTVDTAVHTIYQTNKPEDNDDAKKDIKFNVSMNANAQASAGDYEDLLTFTITGNF